MSEPVLGIIGGGQLGSLLAVAAKKINFFKFNRGERYFKKNTSYLKQMYASYFDFLFLLMTIPTLKKIQ